MMAPDKTDLMHIVLVTGPSGAGRTTAIKCFEDIGFESIDNLPMSLLPRLLDGEPLDRPLVLGIDVRNRDFSTRAMIDTLDTLVGRTDAQVELLYLDCRADVLQRRFSETRRRHPLAPAETAERGIERELDLLTPVRVRADVLLETSEMSPHDLRAELEALYAPKGAQKLALSVHSFSYKRGVPRGLDMVFDCRFLRNPYWDESLRKLDGRNAEVASYVAQDPRFEEFFKKVFDLTELLLPAYIDEGKAHLSIGFGCTGGQHRSVTLTEQMAAAMQNAGWQVSKRHRELERRAG